MNQRCVILDIAYLPVSSESVPQFSEEIQVLLDDTVLPWASTYSTVGSSRQEKPHSTQIRQLNAFSLMWKHTGIWFRIVLVP